MKRLITLALCALVAAPAMATQQNITTVSSATASREALRTALNLRLTATDANFDELYTAIGTRPWVAQETAPADTTFLWFDTDQIPGEVVLKIHTGGVWVAHAIGTGGGDYTLPAATAEALGGVKVGARLSITDGVLSADDQVSSLTAVSVGLGTDSNPSFNSVHASGGNLAAANKQVTKAWASGLPYTADVTSVIHGGKHYICTSSHTAGSTTEPGVGASWATVWEVASGSGFDEDGNFTLTGEWDFTSATVTGLGTATLPPATEGQILQANSSGVYESTSSFAGLINDDGTGADDLWSASKITTQLSGKQATLSAASTITALFSGAGDYLKSDGTKGTPSGGTPAIADITDWPSGLSATELGYVNGATSNLQDQINGISAGSIPHVTSGAPATSGSWNYNTTDHKLRTRYSNGDVYVSSALTLEAAADTTPTAFSFTDETDIATGISKTSNAITVAGINWPAAISVTGSTGYGYSKNSAACTATSGTVSVGDTVSACVTSSGSNSTATTATVDIGGVSDQYSVTTAAASGITDNFNRGDGAIGSNYTAINGSLTIASNKAIGSAWAGKWMYYNTTTGSNDHYAQATVFPGVSSSSDGSGVIVRSNGTTGYMVQLYAGTPGSIILCPFNGSSVAAHVGANIDANITNAPHVLKLSVSGSTFTVWLDGVSQGTWTDSTYSSGQYIGISSRSAGDELSVDDFSGGL